MAEGRSNQGICRTLWLSPKTVETHIRGAFAKLGIKEARRGQSPRPRRARLPAAVDDPFGPAASVRELRVKHDQVARPKCVDLIGVAARRLDERRRGVKVVLGPDQPDLRMHLPCPLRTDVESHLVRTVELATANQHRTCVARHRPQNLGPRPTEIRRLGRRPGEPDRRTAGAAPERGIRGSRDQRGRRGTPLRRDYDARVLPDRDRRQRAVAREANGEGASSRTRAARHGRGSRGAHIRPDAGSGRSRPRPGKQACRRSGPEPRTRRNVRLARCFRFRRRLPRRTQPQ